MNAQHRKAALQALAEYSKATDFDFDAVATSVADESDRGMVVIIGSLTEDLLLTRIMENFVELPKARLKQLTKTGGVLGSWGGKAMIARALGIIDEDDLDILEVLNSMRNACAHGRKHIDFQTKELRDALCLVLNEGSAKNVRESEMNELARAAFVLAASYLWGRIKGESSDQSNYRVQEMLNEAVADALRELLPQGLIAQPATESPPDSTN